MKFLKTYEEHNEGIKSSIAAIGLASSLISTDVKASSQEKDKTKVEMIASEKSMLDSNIQELSKIRKSEKVLSDKDLLNILIELEANSDSDDYDKYKELFDKLQNHLDKKYSYKIAQLDLSKISNKESFIEQVKTMSLTEILGWIGSVCLAICGIPQAWQSFKDKHSHGISWGFVGLWTIGEIFALAYVYDKLDLPLVLNYATNLLILIVILYYKILPKTDFKPDRNLSISNT